MRLPLTRAKTETNSRGFTIVELLIVIVVIAILAAITIVAYNGVQERARASAITGGFNTISKAFRLKATADGRSTWWGDASGYLTGAANPHVEDIIAATNLKDYIQQPPTVSGLTTTGSFWWYDNDSDTYDSSPACTSANATTGVNIVFTGVTQSIASIVDKSLDDGNLGCGKVHYDSVNSRIFYVLSNDSTL